MQTIASPERLLRGTTCWILLALLCMFGVTRIAVGASIPLKAAIAQVLLEHAFDRSLTTGRPQKPWPWADMAPVARVRVPRLGVDRIVLNSGSGQAMAFGPTLLPGGAKLGEPGVSVIAAHRDTHFRFLRLLKIGDVIEVERIDRGWSRYRITRSQVVRSDQFAVAEGSAVNELALSTCYPFDAIRHGPLRYVVQAVPTR
jgi:sortase A